MIAILSVININNIEDTVSSQGSRRDSVMLLLDMLNIILSVTIIIIDIVPPRDEQPRKGNVPVR